MRVLIFLMLITTALSGCTVTQHSANCRVTASGQGAALGPRLAGICDFLMDKTLSVPQAVEIPGVLTFHKAPVCEDRADESMKIIRHDVYSSREDVNYIDPNSRYTYTRVRVAGDDCYDPVVAREQEYQRFRTQQ